MFCCFFNDTATTEIYTLSLHDALPIFGGKLQGATVEAGEDGLELLERLCVARLLALHAGNLLRRTRCSLGQSAGRGRRRSEEHTSELQSRQYIVCRLLLEKK